MKELLKNNTLTICLTIIILLILTLIVKRLNIIFNPRNNNKNINVHAVKDKFYDAPTTTTSNTSNTPNTSSRYNEITYGMNPDCVAANAAAKYCPNSHPNIPCSMVENCQGNGNKHLTDEMKRDIYMYIYLTGLLETSDIFNADNDRYWYNSLGDKKTTTSTTTA